jgi:hypothetical protein
MRKPFVAALIIAAAFTLGSAQESTTTQVSTTPAANTQDTDAALKMGHAPAQTDGIGRAVVVVQDETGNPVKGVYAHLESIWGGDHFCESWNWTNDKGIAPLNPLHMGKLKLKLKAKGYKNQQVTVDASSLGEPVRVTMYKK